MLPVHGDDAEFDDEPEGPIGDVVDAATGLPQLLNEKCPSCVRRPGNLMNLAPGRLDQLEGEAVERGSWVVCHETLPSLGVPVGKQAICRGFWDVHAKASWGCRLAVSWGGPVILGNPRSTSREDEAS